MPLLEGGGAQNLDLGSGGDVDEVPAPVRCVRPCLHELEEALAVAHELQAQR